MVRGRQNGPARLGGPGLLHHDARVQGYRAGWGRGRGEGGEPGGAEPQAQAGPVLERQQRAGARRTAAAAAKHRGLTPSVRVLGCSGREWK